MDDMDCVVDVLQDILIELREMNIKLEDIKGLAPFNSIADVCDKLDSVESAISGVDLSISNLG